MATAKKKVAEKKAAAEWMYTIIRSPVVTEKSTRGSEGNQVTFKVDLDATKPQIKAAVEAMFEVKVKAVNTLIQKGKTKLFRGRKGFRSDAKKAMVTLEPGQTIDTGTGV
jgi:large subunit ribosomal protein L23